MTKKYTSPDGKTTLACINEAEADFMWRNINDKAEYDDWIVNSPPGSVVVDVGCNIGVFAHVASSKGYKVIAFEPVPDLAQCARYNAPSATIVQTPISDENDVPISIDFLPYYTMLSGQEAAKNSAMYEKIRPDAADGFKNAKSIDCVTSTLPVALEKLGIKEHIHLLKIDVEMMEDRVLRGITNDLWARVHNVVIEVHDIGTRIADTVELLKGVGFDVSRTEKAPPNYLLKDLAVPNMVENLDVCLVRGRRRSV